MGKKTISVLVVGLALVSFHLAVAQQPGKVPRIGVLSPNFPGSSPPLDAFRQGLRELGYIEGRNVAIEYRYAEGVAERLPNLATELVALKVDVIFLIGTPATQAAKNATKTIPIVMTNVGDPVASGLVADFAHPDGNVTGFSSAPPQLSGKQLELLKEAFPKISRVAVLWDPTNTFNTLSLGETKIAAGAWRVALQPLEVRRPDDFEPAFSAIKRERASAVIVLRNTLTVIYRTRIVGLATKSRLPVMYPDTEFVDAGGLMSYAPEYAAMFRHAATYVDKILRGAKPADLPVEQPTKFEFVINLKTAKALNLTIPQSVLYRADRVIK